MSKARTKHPFVVVPDAAGEDELYADIATVGISTLVAGWEGLSLLHVKGDKRTFMKVSDIAEFFRREARCQKDERLAFSLKVIELCEQKLAAFAKREGIPGTDSVTFPGASEI